MTRSLLWLFALGCSPGGRIPLGDAELIVDADGALTLRVGEREPFATASGQALTVHRFDEQVDTGLGMWRFIRSDMTSHPLEVVRVDRRAGRILLEAEGIGLGSLEVTDDGDATRFVLTVDGAHQSLAVPVRCDADATFFGFGEQYDAAEHRGESFDLLVSEQGIGRTGDLFPFSGDRHTTYFAMPWWLDARGHGVLFETDRRTGVDLCDTDADTAWIEPVDPGPIAWTVLHGPTPAEVIRQLGDRVGRPAKPPAWAWGNWIMTQGGPEAVRARMDALEAAGIPATALWVQDWTGRRENPGGGYGVQYRWEPDELDLYPEIIPFFEEIHARGYKVLGYVNPFVDPALQHWDEMEAAGMLPRDPVTGETYRFFGPRGQMTQADLTNPATQDYIKTRLRDAVDAIGLDGWMADFAEWLPLDADLHAGDPEAEHNRAPERWQRLTREVMDELRPDGDWVMFARSGWTGVQSVAQIHWVGDQEADFHDTDGLPTVVPAMLSLGLSGQPFVTHDIAGFSGGPSTPELYARWTELGAFTPVFRTHDGNDRANNHRWDADPDTTAHFARFAMIHETLRPELEALADEAATTGMPMVRHLMLAWPDDADARRVHDQYLLGPDLLVAPVLAEGATTRRVYLPAGRWFDVWNGEVLNGPAWVERDAPIGAPPVFSRERDRPDLRAPAG